ncbi:MAG: hypothetical protein LBC88_02195 [Spirochaetaceae bacterium]|jgi:hypothetical protein|nr:hypothetical protein [Spirochaetaceae bacterium]
MKNGKKTLLLLLAAPLFIACSTGSGEADGQKANTGTVTFFNDSSYAVKVHQDAFSGPVLMELRSGQSKKADVRASGNYGVGSTFSIEYRYPITNVFDAEAGEVTAGGIDPNVQINFVVEENKSYTKQIPQPASLEFRNAFLRIMNASGLPFELRYLGTAFKQAGNGSLSVAPNRTGVYKLDGIGAAGRPIQNYTLNGVFTAIPIPGFTAMNGTIYHFEFDGSEVKFTGEPESIVF